ncbi:hypothetical protein [Clostridium cylindrosporum]|uniref:Uncharacterized protein n=1 Tax=Clostridium cylindrosporum DSM 605 TaxID=1121307 RepID=A0A0J8DFA4_CLOCY|nr:hypothetical protein [Clostridium cylindrosporum]KMT22858.1 hypothetical protein CLCY_5c00970 [Clostridium cylindrosporum DSM 605]
MKKVLLLVIALGVILLSSCSPKKENLTGDVTVPKPLNEKTFQDTLKLTKLDSSMDINPEDIRSIGFNRVIIKTQGLRIDSGNYKTDFKRKNKLMKQTALLEEADISYYIEITTGPGISNDGKNLSLFTKGDNMVFFAQMVKEIIEMNKDNTHFSGIILSVGNTKIHNDTYYKTLNEISNRVLKSYDVPLLISLDPMYFESNNTSLPLEYFDNPKVGFNIDMNFKCDKYPGKAKFNDSEIELSKNRILEKLIAIKDSNKNSRKILLSLKCPWSEECSVLVKDIFEIMKMVGFEFSLSYSNTNNEFDFSNNKNIITILNKY